MKFPRINTKQTSSGWLLIHCEQKYLPLSSLRILFGGGALSDQDKGYGITKMADQVLEKHLRKCFEGTRLPNELSLVCDLTHSTLSLDCLSDDLLDCMTLLGKEIKRCQVGNKDVKRQQFLTKQSINAGSDHPDILCHWMGRELYFGEHHPLRFGTGGDFASIDKIDKIALSESIDRRYKKPNGCVILVGDFDLDAAEKWVDNNLGKAAPYTVKTPPCPNPKFGSYALQHNGSEQIEISIYKNAPSRKSPLASAATLGTIGLGGCFLSRLNRKLRIESGLTYGANASYTNSDSDGLLVISTSVDRNRIGEALDMTAQTLSDCGQHWTNNELQMVKENHKNLVYSVWETTGNIADCLESTIVQGLNPKTIQHRMTLFQQQSIDEIEAAMTEIASSDQCLSLCGDLRPIRSKMTAMGLDFEPYRPQKLSPQ